ncbi:L-psp endoribonuclease family protein [Grosmannia clavigera kw1407]|uniref:L-psp endoribonuclease family protein n=1 Tax=Grosmannia clavigera (strain kw1407 / UAMH 11150) TaxID=655863 RepID=F0XLZ4_GROCL|nr:L-psp endoribonuclease family protein [Grosmannia clavigera kw1407]EFX01381.1 L-psp endoribonuclease family protein [Grosmannia clavigera kw1407]
MSKEAVRTDKAPAPAPIYSQAIKANGLIFCSGQTGKDATGTYVSGTVQDRTHQCIKNLEAVLVAAGSSLDKVVEVNVFLADIDDFAKLNEVYIQYFGDVKPARTCVAVKNLPDYTDVEIKCTALA